MRNFLAATFALAFLNIFSAQAQAQTLKLEELTKTFASASYPNSVFDMLEAKGFNRLDKQYPDFCERVIYFYDKGGKPSMFINPQVCNRALNNQLYPISAKNEMELQFQKSSQANFDYLSGLIRKQCTPLPTQNATENGEKSTVQAYRHAASGTTFLIQPTNKVSYIYLLK